MERRRDRRFVVAIGLLAGMLAMASCTGNPAPRSPAYPDQLPNFATGHGGLTDSIGGTTPRKGLVIFVDIPDADDARGVALPAGTTMEEWFAGRYFDKSQPSVAGYYDEWSRGRLNITPLDEAQGNADDGYVEVETTENHAQFFEPQLETAQDPMGAVRAVNTKALRMADEFVDFAKADTNDDGTVTSDELFVSVIWHPTGTNNGDPIARPHNPVELDGKQIRLLVLPQHHTATDLMSVIHEVGHALTGMRDHYGYKVSHFALNGITEGPDTNLQGPNAYERMQFGWSEPTVVVRDGYYKVRRADAGSVGGYLLYDPERGEDDYLLVENRQPYNLNDGNKLAATHAYDAAGPDEGLLVWRIVKSNYRVDDFVRPGIDLIMPIPQGWMPCRETPLPKCYPGSATDAWDANSDPFRTTVEVPWAGEMEPARVAIRAIGPSADTMRVYFDVPGPGILADCGYSRTPQRVSANGRSDIVRVIVRNTGEAPDEFEFALSDLPSGWSTAGSVKATLEPATDGTIDLSVTPPRNADGVTKITVTARSTTDSNVTSTCPLTVEPTRGN